MKALSPVSSRDIRLVIIDVEMPGSARLDQTLETKPGIRVLRVSSGPGMERRIGFGHEPGHAAHPQAFHCPRAEGKVACAAGRQPSGGKGRLFTRLGQRVESNRRRTSLPLIATGTQS
jgi:hypothetical protein